MRSIKLLVIVCASYYLFATIIPLEARNVKLSENQVQNVKYRREAKTERQTESHKESTSWDSNEDEGAYVDSGDEMKSVDEDSGPIETRSYENKRRPGELRPEPETSEEEQDSSSDLEDLEADVLDTPNGRVQSETIVRKGEDLKKTQEDPKSAPAQEPNQVIVAENQPKGGVRTNSSDLKTKLQTGPVSVETEPEELIGQEIISTTQPLDALLNINGIPDVNLKQSLPTLQSLQPSPNVSYSKVDLAQSVVNHKSIISEQQQETTVEIPKSGENNVAEIELGKPVATVSKQEVTNAIPHEPSLVYQNRPIENLNNLPYFDFQIDQSCTRAQALPGAILNMTIERILGKFKGENCSQIPDFRLQAATNKEIKGFVMETSPMRLNPAQLTSGFRNVAKCSQIEELGGTKGQGGVRFRLNLTQEVGNHKLRSRWRLYPRMPQEDIPLSQFGLDRGSRTKAGSKCERFKIESGDFYLELLSLNSSQSFDITLTKMSQTAYAADKSFGGRIRMTEFKVNELYLDHKIYLDAGDRLNLAGLSPTVQILHDRNNHHRRNNWLLDMYGNWLRHEYRRRLKQFLAKPLVEGLNSCLDN